jgi:hypothetical protein
MMIPASKFGLRMSTFSSGSIYAFLHRFIAIQPVPRRLQKGGAIWTAVLLERRAKIPLSVGI